ncbi:ATP-binding cassette domain-containing protein, partial [Parasphingorhabdus sp.]|uniref:ATP-binding cassette domain-containing protein n=1 Tax=Parasphingorhabdus sp. TaxID=2709688 RepID=UPI003C780AB5
LSGGQQQRVAIARALVTNPLILLADEPTGALDTKTSADIMEIFQQLNDSGITIIVVTHEADIADHAKRRIQFRDGKILDDQATMNRRIPVS